jgi:hypothetical protein
MEQQDNGTARESTVKNYEQSAEQLELAARHLRIAAQHVRDGEIPRGCAHALAAYGHMLPAQRTLDETAIAHASRSNPA